MNLRTVEQAQSDLNQNLQVRIDDLEKENALLKSGIRIDLNKILSEISKNYGRTDKLEHNIEWLLEFAIGIQNQYQHNWQSINQFPGKWESARIVGGVVVNGKWVEK
jgi:hypothetical protein